MNIKTFTISIFDDGSSEEEMNRFLRGNKIIDITQEMVQLNNGAYWCFCVKYLNRSITSSSNKKRVDYREILDEPTFKKFATLREIRKAIASADAVPAYMVFTDEELALRELRLSEENYNDLKVEVQKQMHQYQATTHKKINDLEKDRKII